MSRRSRDYQLQNVSDVWILNVPPEHLMDVFRDQRHEKIFEIKGVDDEYVVCV